MMEGPTTDWSLIRLASNATTPGGKAAFSRLISIYLPALKWYAQTHLRISPQDVDDAVQQFVLDKFIEKQLLSFADPNRGKFRALLVTTFKRWAIDQRRRRQAEATTPDGDTSNIESDDGTAQFELRWAENVFAEAIERTRRHLTQRKLEGHWLMLRERIIDASFNEPARDFRVIAADAGLTQQPWRPSNALMHAKRVFRQQLLALLGAAGDPEAKDAIIDLKKIFERKAGRRDITRM